MAFPEHGYEGALGLGEESTYGTSVARTNWLYARDLGLERQLDYRRRPHLIGPGSGSVNQASQYLAADDAGGTIVVPFGYNDSTIMLLKHWIGSIATTGVSAPYTHTATLTTPDALPEGLTIEQIRGTEFSINAAEVFEGCVVNSGTFAVSYGEIATLSLDFIAETSGGRASAGTPSFGNAAAQPLIFHHFDGSFGWNTLSGDILSCEVTVNHSRARRNLLSSLHTAKPHVSNYTEILLRITREHDTNEVHADYLDQSAGDATLTFDDPDNVNNQLDITVQNAECVEYSDTPSGPGRIEQTFTLRAFSDGTDEGISFAVQNGNSAYSDN